MESAGRERIGYGRCHYPVLEAKIERSAGFLVDPQVLLQPVHSLQVRHKDADKFFSRLEPVLVHRPCTAEPSTERVHLPSQHAGGAGWPCTLPGLTRKEDDYLLPMRCHAQPLPPRPHTHRFPLLWCASPCRLLSLSSAFSQQLVV